MNFRPERSHSGRTAANRIHIPFSNTYESDPNLICAALISYPAPEGCKWLCKAWRVFAMFSCSSCLTCASSLEMILEEEKESVLYLFFEPAFPKYVVFHGLSITKSKKVFAPYLFSSAICSWASKSLFSVDTKLSWKVISRFILLDKLIFILLFKEYIFIYIFYLHSFVIFS